MLRWSTHDDPSAWECDWRDNADAFDDDKIDDGVAIGYDNFDCVIADAKVDLKLCLKEGSSLNEA